MTFLPIRVPLPFSSHTPGQPLLLTADFHHSPSFRFLPKKTNTYTKSCKIEETRYNVAVWFKFFIPSRARFSPPPPSQPLPFPPYVRCSPSFQMTPKKTKTYTKSYKMPIQLVLVSFGKMHIIHNYALLCIILNFLPLSEPIPIISQKS